MTQLVPAIRPSLVMLLGFTALTGIVYPLAATSRNHSARASTSSLAEECGFFAELARQPGRFVTHIHLQRAVWDPAHENEPAIGYRLVDSDPGAR